MKNILYTISISIFLFACGETETTSEKHEEKIEENHENHSHKNEKHGHNHANKHMHNTPVTELIKAFESEDRAKTQKPEKVIELFGNIEGKKILDIGAGSGYFSYRLADKGAHVIAGDVNDKFLDYLIDKNSKSKRTKGSVTPKKLPFDSPALSPNEIDEAIIVNTYHHIENREEYFKQVLDGLKPGGRLMVVDFIKKHFDEKVEGPPFEMKVAADVVMQELLDAGFNSIVINYELLPYQYIVTAWKHESKNTQKKK